MGNKSSLKANFEQKLDFRGHISTFGGEKTHQSGLLRPKTVPTQQQNNIPKSHEVQKTVFLVLKIVLSEDRNNTKFRF